MTMASFTAARSFLRSSASVRSAAPRFSAKPKSNPFSHFPKQNTLSAPRIFRSPCCVGSLMPCHTATRRFQGGGGGGGLGWIITFEQLKEKMLDHVRANPADCLIRNYLRLSFWNQIHKFAALDSLLAKNLVFLQLVLVDANREIQEKMYQGLFRQNPEDPNVNVAEQSRLKFKVLIPCLLQDTERWVFSRALVIKGYNRSLLGETLMKLLSHDPVGGLKDITFDIPLGTPDSEVSKQHNDLMEKAVKEYKDTDVPLGTRCAEIFLFIAGDFSLDNDGGVNSREALQTLLRYLYTEDGIQKLHGFDEMTASCPKVSPEKISVLKDMHLTA